MPTKLKSTGVEFPDNTTQITEGVTSVSAGNALTGGGSGSSVTINHADTSSQSSVNNSGSTVIQDVTLDDFGHVTGLSSTSISATPSTNDVLSAYAGADFNGVGTYSVAGRFTASLTERGSNYSGSSLLILDQVTSGGSIEIFPFQNFNDNSGSSGLSGTWKAMQSSREAVGGQFARGAPTLFLRIA